MVEDFGIDLDEARDFIANKERRRTLELDARFEKARTDFAAILRTIVERHVPRRVWQWGSLLDRATFSEISDIDIAVEGLRGPEEWFAIVGEAMGLTDFPLDIVEMERVGEANAARIRERGRLVHGEYP